MSSYVPYTNFLREVMPFCPGVPQSVAVDAIRNACIDFCETSRWLQYTPTAQNGVAGVATYSIYTPTDTRFVEVQEAWWDTYRLLPKSNDELTALYGMDWRTLNGTPIYYTQTDDSTLVLLVPSPQANETLSLTLIASICPTRDSTTVDGDLYERWLEVIAAGARARLMAMPAQAFSNQAQALMWAREFKFGKGAATIQRNRGLTRTPTIMRPRRFI